MKPVNRTSMLGAALALILTVILLIITLGYVRAAIRQGALQ